KTSFTIAENAILWGKLKINDTMLFQMEGGYEVKSNFETTSQNVNLDFFGIKMGFYPSSVAQIDVDLGRIFISDSYGLIFNNSVDGGKLKISLPVANLSMFAGYTGLLNGKNFQIVNSTIEVDQDAIYSFAPGFMVAGFDITSKNTFENHSLGLNVSSFVPVQKNETRPTSIYGQIYANGPIVNSLYYDLVAAVGIYTENQLKAGVMMNGEVAYYPSFIKSIFSANILFATDTFYSFIDPSVVIAKQNSINGILKFGLATSIRPLDSLLVTLGGDFAMDVEGSNVFVDCFQWTTSASWQILSDIKLALNLGQKIGLNEDSSDSFFGALSFVLNY
ncbi:MAG: hypothetical protein UIH41_07630, partial [Treponemataceae bacterium]|nr:hypothetical protein [Treponemataceae bacterium]